jgi:hypothetical protein
MTKIMLSKQVTWITAGIISMAWFLVNLLGVSAFCGAESHSSCRESLHATLLSAIIFLPVFGFAVVTSFLSERIFRAWQKFTLWWVPLSFISVLVTSDSPGFFFPSAQEMLGMVMWGLYVVLSIAIIAWKYRQNA